MSNFDQLALLRQIGGLDHEPGGLCFQGRVSINPPPVAWIGPTGQLMPHEIFVAWREQYPDQGHEHFRPLVYGDAA